MRKVKIIKGAYGYRPEGKSTVQTVTRHDAPIELPDEEAARLVSLRVAEYCLDPEPEAPGSGVATGQGGADGIGEGDNPPEGKLGAEGQETGELPDVDDAEGGESDEDDTLDIADGHFTAESLTLLTNDNLRKLAADLGADVSKCKTKAELVAVLVGVEIEDDGLPPDLGAEAPVL